MEESTLETRLKTLQDLGIQKRWVELLFLSRVLLKELQASSPSLARDQGKVLSLHLQGLVQSKNYDEALGFLRTKWSFSYAFDEIDQFLWMKNQARVFAAHARVGDLMKTLRNLRQMMLNSDNDYDQLNEEILQLLMECNCIEFGTQFQDTHSQALNFPMNSQLHFQAYIRHFLLYPAGSSHQILYDKLRREELDESLAQKLMDEMQNALLKSSLIQDRFTSHLMQQDQLPEFLKNQRDQFSDFQTLQREAIRALDWDLASPSLLPIPGLDVEWVDEELQISLLGKFLIETQINLFEKCIQTGCNVNHTFRGEPLLYHAMDQRNFRMLNLLLDYGADPNLKTRRSLPLLMIAMYFFEEAVPLLLEHRASLDCASYEGNTPLHIAVEKGDLNRVRLFLRYGANPLLKNQLGINPYDLAVSLGEDEIAKSLKSFL